MRKLKNCAGETLIETLISILIVTLASVVLVQMVITGCQIDVESGKADKMFSSALAAAEGEKTSRGSGTVTIGGADGEYTVPVEYYGGGTGDRSLTSYSAGSAP